MPSVELALSSPWFIALLLILAAAAAAFVFYRATLPPLPFPLRLLLALLRGTALALIFLLLLDPRLRFVRTTAQSPVLAVLADNSLSMRITDRTGDRRAVLQEALRTARTALPAGAEVRFYTFGLNLAPAAGQPDSLPAGEEATDIARALRGLGEELRSVPVAAAVLVTDGVVTAGRNPLYDAEQLGIPLFTVGVGDSSPPRDIVISRIAANTTVYAGNTVPLDVTVRSSGYGGERVEVTLADGARVLARAPLLLEPGTREYSIRLTYTPEGDGAQRYGVGVTAVPGELTAANNRKNLFVRVLPGRTRVLMLAGAPSEDLAVLKQTLREDRTIESRSLTFREGERFYEGELPAGAVDSADCLVLVGFPTAAVPGTLLDRLRGRIEARRIPLLTIASRQLDAARLQALGPIVPYTASQPSRSEQLVFAEPTAEGKRHPVIGTGGDHTAWDRLPPVFRTQTPVRARPEATVLATVRLGGVSLPDPLIIARRVNRHRSLAVTGYGLWRWRMLAQGATGTDQHLATFLSGAVRWLTSPDETRPVTVRPIGETFAQGEPAAFTGQVYDPSTQPVDDARLTVSARRGDQVFEATLRALGSGRYEGSIDGLPPGDYTFQARAEREGAVLGEDRGRFVVGDLTAEYMDVAMNTPLLRGLAERTGGAFFTAGDLDGLGDSLSTRASFAPRTVTTASDHKLWTAEFILALIVLLLSLEWFIRKRNGLL